MIKAFFCLFVCFVFFFFFFKQKTAYEIGTGDWSSDVCSSDLYSLYKLLSPLVPYDKYKWSRRHLTLMLSYAPLDIEGTTSKRK